MNQPTKIIRYTVSVLVMLIAIPAYAHHPEIEASASCDVASGFVIDYTSTSWSPGTPEGENGQIDILIDGVLVGTGAYNDGNGFSFSDSAPAAEGAAPGSTVAVTAVAVDSWGSGAAGGQSTSVAVTLPDEPCVPSILNGRFTGGGHQIRVDGVRVTRGLTIHCDLLLSNNLEVNWQGNKFHMNEHLTTLQCSDDPAIIQAPPPAPLDTLIGVGTGRYNGEDGFTIVFVLVDAGEPGVMDEMGIVITNTTTGVIVLDVPQQLIDGGNLQAHFDQPHK